MSYTVTLYVCTSDPHVMSKTLAKLADVTCDFKDTISKDNPTIYIQADDTYDPCNYVYIPHFNRYYYASVSGGRGQTLTIECHSDPLMSFANQIKTCPVVVSRNPWLYDKYIHDDMMPVESRTVRSSFAFPNDLFQKGKNNCYILTTLGGS